MDRPQSGRDSRQCVAVSPEMVQGRSPEIAEFYEVAADHKRESPATSMIPSMTSRNASGSSRNTKRLATKAPNISDDPAITPFSAISEVSAPNRSKVTDLLK